ncbi:MAG: hydrogenase nickel incorporation protein HypB, partial [Clostridium sp.]|nr:hydrogenase nickel incorporation protein HypB [Clostridium sp.]
DELKKSGIKVGVIEGDIAGKIDAEKMAERGIPVVQLNTDGACHIEAMSIKNILPQFDLDHLDIIIIENIGNLVCPAEFDIGESLKVALLSIPEGDDKVEKYPLMFTRADALVLTKYDLINYFEFNEERVDKNALIRNDELKLFKVNSKNEDDIKEFKNWLISKIEE